MVNLNCTIKMMIIGEQIIGKVQRGEKVNRVAVDAGCFSETGNLIFFRFTPRQDGTAHVPE